jgi:hypothetical protein
MHNRVVKVVVHHRTPFMISRTWTRSCTKKFPFPYYIIRGRFWLFSPVKFNACDTATPVKLYEPKREKLLLYNIIGKQTFSFVASTVLHVKVAFVSRTWKQMLLRFFRVRVWRLFTVGGGLE